MAEPNSTILTRIHASHPDARVRKTEGHMWEAIIRAGTAERAVYRRSLAALEQRLDELASRTTAGG